MSTNQQPIDPKHLEILQRIPAAPVCGHWPHADYEAALAAERARADAAEQAAALWKDLAHRTDAIAVQYRERSEAAEQALAEWRGLAREAAALTDECLEQREAAVAALEFYASPATYQRPLTEYGWGQDIPIQHDSGKRARAALAADAAGGEQRGE